MDKDKEKIRIGLVGGSKIAKEVLEEILRMNQSPIDILSEGAKKVFETREWEEPKRKGFLIKSKIEEKDMIKPVPFQQFRETRRERRKKKRKKS